MVVYNLKRKKEKAYKVHLVIYIYIGGDTRKKKSEIYLWSLKFDLILKGYNYILKRKKEKQFYCFFIGKIEF